MQAPSESVERPRRQPPRWSLLANRAATRMVLALLAVLAITSITRILSGEQNLTTGGTFGAAINSAIPIMLAGLGGLWAERAGVVNIGLEGQMILGTYFAAYFEFKTGSAWMLIVGGIVGGLIGGALHAIATVGFNVDQIISGVAINLLAPGITKYLAGIYFTTPEALSNGGGPTQSPKVHAFSTWDWHAADVWLDKVTAHHWFVISDLAGFVDALISQLNLFTVIALALIPLTAILLWRTAFGLRLRSCGENPPAAETLGVKVYTLKATAVIVSGVLAGIAGAFLVDYSGQYHDGQTTGRGYIGLAAMIFGNWNPAGLLVGSGLFGYTDGLQAQNGGDTVQALLLLIAILLALGALYTLYRPLRERRRAEQGDPGRSQAGQVRRGVLMLVAAALVLLWYLSTNSIPAEFATYSPQIITLLVLAVASQRLRMPAADGLPWRRGQGG